MAVKIASENGTEYYRESGTERTDEIVKLEKICFTDSWSEKNIKSQLENQMSFNICADEEGKCVGACCLSFVGGEAELLRIGVLPDYRKKGIASEMMKIIDDFCVAEGIKVIFLEVRTDNPAAVSLYRKSGFSEISVRKNYYRDCDALIMSKNI